MRSRNCAVCIQLVSGGLGALSLLVEVLWRRGTLQDVFPALHDIRPHRNIFQTCVQTRAQTEEKEEKASHMC